MKILVANGDSWTYGSELFDPRLIEKIDKKTANLGKEVIALDWHSDNHSYRIQHSYPYLLAKKFSARCINLAVSADNNNSIADRTIDFILKHDLRGPDVFVVIGWTAPERNDFYMDVGTNVLRHKIFNINHYDHFIDSSSPWNYHNGFKEYLIMHFNHLIVPEEYWDRFIRTVAMTELFLKSRNIPYLMFNAFYPSEPVRLYSEPDLFWGSLCDVNISAELDKLRPTGYGYSDNLEYHDNLQSLDTAKELWKTVDSIRWYNKDQLLNSFRAFVGQQGEHTFVRPQGHPNEEGHRLWAEELCRYIKQHRLD